ncbi:cadherin-15 isoform X2 [Xenopus laevis]|nr:cadherin-15 isoform X2 [Xenopus laevis]XP_041446099.1 cadherin-15 isoform X2 [Xenopus laevis]
MVWDENSPETPVFFPWRQRGRGTGKGHRVKRAWVIPPISVPENFRRIPMLLVQLKSDKQHHGSVIYSIKGPGVDEEPRGIFTINKNTGEVYLNAVLDREKIERFKLEAFAVDEGGSTLEDPTKLEIVVLDQNDNRPVFVQEEFTGRLLEGAIPGTFVLKVEATDADDPRTDNAELRYSIIQQEAPEMFSINQNTGEIRTVQVGLDREVVGSYNLTVQVADMIGEGLTSTARAIIIIEDINDNPPEFMQEFSMEVPENKSNLGIGRVNVTDKDLPGSVNWRVRYFITKGDSKQAFSIQTDPQTNEGILFLIKPLDHEEQEFYQLTISAENEAKLSPSAPRPTRSQTQVNITVKNLNEPPVFLENPKVVRVKERLAAGSEITVYTAVDPDNKLTQKIRYSLVSDPANWLSLDENSGQLRARYLLDRKSPFLQRGWYTALIAATDNAVPPLSSTGTLSVEVQEVNDQAPVLLSHSGDLCKNSQQGNGMLLLSATDEDLPPQAHPFHFQLDPSFTELTSNWSLSPVNDTHALLQLMADVQDGVYTLPLWVSDSGNPPLAQVQFLNVSVCLCDALGTCKGNAVALFGSGTGISLTALIIIMSSIALLLVLVLLLLLFRCSRPGHVHKGLLADSEDDVRDNIFNYDEQGGGEEDQDGYDMMRLRNPGLSVPPSPRLKPPIRRDTPYNQTLPRYPRRPTDRPSDIADFIQDVSVSPTLTIILMSPGHNNSTFFIYLYRDCKLLTQTRVLPHTTQLSFMTMKGRDRWLELSAPFCPVKMTVTRNMTICMNGGRDSAGWQTCMATNEPPRIQKRLL